jgi:cytochrome c oxidase subunit 2
MRQKCKILLSWFFFCFLTQTAFGINPFDDLPYKASPGIRGTPMDTLAALTDFGQRTNHVYFITTVILVLVFLAVCLPLIYIMFRFKAPKGDLTHLPPPKQVHGNALLEFTWTIIPVILLLFIAVPTWEAIFAQPEKAPEGALEIEVIGHQWWWEFRYPKEGIVTANELHLPENRPVFLTMWSDDVIHSFWIPKFGGKKDVLPGVHNTLFFTSPAVQDPKIKGGEYYQGQCAELCGLSHALMRFEAVVHHQDEFDRWVLTHNEPPQVTTETHKKGEMVFNQCQACHTISGTPSENLDKQMAAMNQKKAGPNLTNFGSRRTLGAGIRLNTPENLAQWIETPEHMKPGSRMVGLGLSKEDIHAVAAYIRQTTAKNYVK